MTAKKNSKEPTTSREKSAELSGFEQSVLGTLAVRPDLYHDVSQVIQPFMFACFPVDAKRLFEAIENGDEISQQWLGSIRPMIKYSDSSGISRNVLSIREAWQKDSERELYQEAASDLEEGKNPEEVQTSLDERLEMVRQWIPQRKYETKTESWVRLVDSMGKGAKGKRKGVMTGFREIDENGGLVAPDTIVIAGRPGMGKTDIGLDISLNAAKSGSRVAYFTLEMGRDQIKMRLIAKESGVSFSKQRWAMLQGNNLGKENFHKVHEAATTLYELPLIIIDDVQKLSGIKKAYRMLCRTYDVDLFVFDYLQRFDGEEDKTHESIGKLMTTIKNLGNENKKPNLVLAQLSRATEIRGGTKRPQMSDLKGSGDIEQEADLIFLAYRPEYYGITRDDEKDVSLIGICELMCVKDRPSLGLDVVRLKYNKDYFKYESEVEPEISSQFPTTENNQIDKPNHLEDTDDIPF